jgi:shikimate dehydrogenase
MHGAAFRALGLPHTYEAVRSTADELPRVVLMLREGTFDGLNVTVPHKERVLSLADHLDASARVAGAANTLVRGADGRIVAYNTDAPALAAELRRLLGPVPLPAGSRALVLGSGGASRAAIAALGVDLGFADVVVRARAFGESGRKEAFAASAPCPVTPQPWCASPASEARTLAIVQATSAGMQGADANEASKAGEAVTAVVAWDALPRDAVAIDVVYAPPSTPWLQAALAQGLRCDNGLGMLARQGALALELWLGVEAPLEVMRAAIE